MDFLNQAIAQVSELFRSMTPGARITAGLLLAVVVASMGYLFKQGTAGPDAFLFGGAPLSDGELTRIEAAIAKAKLTGATREGNRIRVPSGQQAAYTAAVADGDALPRDFNTILETALGKAGQWESSQATRERMKIARQSQLSEIVRQFPWVENAVVTVAEEPPRGLSNTKQVKATVSVKPRTGENLDGRKVKVLKNLIAHSIIGLQIEDVAVTNLGEGGAGDFGSDMTAGMDVENEYYQIKVEYEQYKQRSLAKLLSDIPGIRVEVSAELDDTISEKTRNVKPDPKTVAPNREVTKSDTTEQLTTDGGGRPGVTVQGPGRPNANEVAARQNTSKTTSKESETQNSVGGLTSEVLRNGYTPKDVWATVTVPGSYVESVWKLRNKAATDPPKPEELTPVKEEILRSVENIVEPLLPRPNKGEDSYKHVRVVVLDSLPVPAIEPPSLTSNAMAWAGQYWSTVAMLGVAMFSLLVLRSTIRGGSSTMDSNIGTASPTLTLHSEEPSAGKSHEEDQETDERPRLRLKKGKSVKDDLVEIVREDPDAAAEILRSWIGKAG